MADTPIKYSDLIKPDSSITDLIKQLDELSDAYTNALQNIKNESIQLAASMQKMSGATEEGRKTIRKAADDADRLEKAQRELTFAESENAKKLAELRIAAKEQNDINKLLIKINQSAEGSYNRLSAQYSLNKIYLNNMTKAERENTQEGRDLVTQTREIYEEMKRLQEVTGKHQLNVGNYTEASDAIAAYGDKLKASLGLNNAFGESILALGRGAQEAESVFTAISDGAKALGNTLLGLLKNPVFLSISGIAAAGAAFKWWYDYNTGLQEATRLTQQFTSLAGDELKAYRNQVQAVADTFDKDFKETLIAANALSKQFGISSAEAINLVQAGFIAGGDANGEFLDTLKEYPAYFKEAGISADQFIAIVTQTNKSGVFSDKGVDAIKEANLRLREMTTATAAALDGIGISSVQVQKDLQSGAKTTFEVMQDVSARLSELPDSSAKVGAAIADIFGGPGEDAGLQYLRTLKDISTNLTEVKGQAGILGQLQEEQLQSQLELNNALSALFDATGGNFETLTTKAKIFLTDGLTALIKGVTELLNEFIELYNESVLFRTLWNGIIAGFKTGFDIIGNLIGFAIEQVRSLGTVIKGALTLDLQSIKKGLSDYAASFGNLVKYNIKDLGKNVQDAVQGMQKKIKPITIPVNVGSQSVKTGKGSARVTGTAGQAGGTQTGKAGKTGTVQNIENIYKKNLDAVRKLQDAELQLEADGWTKRQKQAEYQYGRQIEDIKHRLQTEKDLTATAREAMNATIAALEKQQTDALLKIENERQLQELELQKKSIEARLATVRQGTNAEFQLRMLLLDTEQRAAELKDKGQPMESKQGTEVLNANFNAQRAKLQDEYTQAQLHAFDMQQELAQSEFDLLRNSEARKTQFKLQAEKERLQKVLDLNKQAGTKLSEVEVSTIKNTIEKINQEIEESKGDERGKDIYGLFGLNLDDRQKEAINTSMEYALDALNTFTEARVAAADAAVQQAEKEVDAAQTALEAELEARANGYASNVTEAQKELELAKKTQEKAQKQQQKAQKQQQAIQSLQQVSNMVTATALIWSQLGFPLAIPAIAVMWASFAASKIKAAQLTKQTATETYGEGTVELLQGGSHRSGNDIDLGTKTDGTRRRAEGGEFFAVINKRNSRRFRKEIPDVIHSLNDGTFSEKYLKAYDGANSLTLNVAGSSPDLRQLAADVNAIKEQGKYRTYMDARGNMITEYKNIKRKITTA